MTDGEAKSIYGPLDEDIIANAAALATRAHEGQKRKYTGEPYVTHCQAVAALVASVPHTPEMIAAALLHDVIEDTDTDFDAIVAACGETVGRYVVLLSDTPRSLGMNRERRKAHDRERLAAAPPEVQTIKYADLIDNLSSIVEHDPGFAKVYRYEKQQLLKVMTKGDPTMYQRAMERAT
jgi:(p)ppGpp synthase/HD superfamily hydrolase